MPYSPDWKKEAREDFWRTHAEKFNVSQEWLFEAVADYWIAKLQAREEWLKQEAELWMLRLHNEPERWTVEQALRNLFTPKN